MSIWNLNLYWLYVLIMSHSRFRLNLQSIVAWLFAIASFANWLSVRMRTKWLWARVQLQSLYLYDYHQSRYDIHDTNIWAWYSLERLHRDPSISIASRSRETFHSVALEIRSCSRLTRFGQLSLLCPAKMQLC